MRAWLNDARKQKSLTQEEVAQYLGVTSTAIVKYERGERTPKPKTAQKLGELLGFDWTQFYTS